MVIGGYTIEDRGAALKVRQYESGWFFSLYADDADDFRERMNLWSDDDGNFEDFLHFHEYYDRLQ